MGFREVVGGSNLRRSRSSVLIFFLFSGIFLEILQLAMNVNKVAAMSCFGNPQQIPSDSF